MHTHIHKENNVLFARFQSGFLAPELQSGFFGVADEEPLRPPNGAHWFRGKTAVEKLVTNGGHVLHVNAQCDPEPAGALYGSVPLIGDADSRIVGGVELN